MFNSAVKYKHFEMRPMQLSSLFKLLKLYAINAESFANLLQIICLHVCGKLFTCISCKLVQMDFTKQFLNMA